MFEKLVIPGIIASCVLLIIFAVYAAIQDGKQWEEFRTSHDCKITAHIKGEVFNTFGTDSKGNMTVGIASTGDKTGWICNDGITYYR